MAVLEKIRVKFGMAVTIIIALALLSFLIDPSTLESAMNSMSSKYDVGQIAGKSISYTDFQGDIDRYTTINQIMTGSSVQNEQQQTQIRNAAWQELINKYMFIKNAKAAGIGVGEAEMLALTTGDDPSPVIAMNQFFMDENGNFSKEQLVQFVQAASTDPNLKVYWNYIQNTILTQQYYAKYGSLFDHSNISNVLEEATLIEDNNTTADVDMVSINGAFVRDSTITVSPSEIKAYYKSHSQFYKQDASRDIEYVVFEVVPSTEDIAATNDKMTEVYDEFATTDNMKAFLLKNSESQLTNYWYKKGELASVSSDIDAYVADNNGTSPVYSKDNVFYAARVMASAMVPDSAYVKHILLQGTDAAKLADSLLTVVSKGGDFAANAALYSADKGSADDGTLGNIGWLTQTYMIPGFESVITADVNKPFILDTQFGKHIVVVTKKSAPVAKKQVALLTKTALASKETFNNYYSQANKFATISAGTVEGYKRAVDSLGVYSHVQNRVLESTSTYGSVESAKEITRWVFDAKAGKASNIITVNNNFFFVVALNTIHKEGKTPINEVSGQIFETLYQRKNMDKLAETVAKASEGKTTLEEIAEANNTSVIEHMSVALSAMGAMSTEPAILGAISAAEQGKIVGPIKGSYGVHYIRVNSKETGSYYTDDDAEVAAGQKAQYNSQMLMYVMMEAANVKDNRARFF